MTTFNTPEEAVAAATASAVESFDYVEFDGQNCDEGECGGWDGTSKRCSCGNRRVYWETTQADDGKFYAYAAAC